MELQKRKAQGALSSEFVDILRNRVESEFLPKWEALVEELTLNYPVEGIAWSHGLGPSGHTFGVEFTSSAPGFGSLVYIIADIDFRGPEAKVVYFGLYAIGPQSAVTKFIVNQEPMILDTQAIQEIIGWLDEWSPMLRWLVLYPRVQSGFAVIGGGGSDKVETREYSTAQGDETDIKVWESYLATYKQPVFVVDHAWGRQEVEGQILGLMIDEILSCTDYSRVDAHDKCLANLIATETIQIPNLSKNPNVFLLSRTEWSGSNYSDSSRSCFANSSEAVGIVMLSRVGYFAERCVFIRSWMDPLSKTPDFALVSGALKSNNWSFQEHRINLEELLRLRGEQIWTPRFDFQNHLIDGISKAEMHGELDEKLSLEVQFSDGSQQIFKVVNQKASGSSWFLSPPYLVISTQNYYEPKKILEACREWHENRTF